ncbi:MAG: hypothetical protein A3H02_02745 [Candidatus Niyogibacteria bacterium RIFCSPLOWO2_12_FULL_41_13]|uniref:Uncharacterized protein n=1 Tax=Candidatus Niyogibacteria bacterium RIFCSPLOWO2_12_FULL_41_13 TaxID=1801726 RepID=A0A1G2F1Z4_9BACT|nr:MAG: hypothetical protein A3H02_02745 [Candidatus Niyogibacteria bacterium RIFCSPLOWO2_12_FULL_41_13]
MEIKFDMEGGCNLVEGVGFRHIKITELEVVSFLRPGEEFISGEEMVVRAKELGANLSRRHAEYLLEHHDEIPKEFQKYYLVFTGTILSDHSGHRLVPYLYWDGKRWFLSFYWLGHDLYSNYRLVRLRD